MKYFLITVLLSVLIFGCATYSSVKLGSGEILGVVDSNSPIEFTGESANIIAQQLADNLKNKQAMLSDMFAKSGELFAGLVVVMVGGFIFWGLTRSRYGWVIPSACIGGMVAMGIMITHSKLIFTGVLIVSAALLIWKAVEYHTERNQERDRLIIANKIIKGIK